MYVVANAAGEDAGDELVEESGKVHIVVLVASFPLSLPAQLGTVLHQLGATSGAEHPGGDQRQTLTHPPVIQLGLFNHLAPQIYIMLLLTLLPGCWLAMCI